LTYPLARVIIAQTKLLPGLLVMTHQEAQDLLKDIIQAKDKDELQGVISRNVSRCDGVFFAELEKVVEQFRAKNDEGSARKLKEVGDFMARLRFMI
jgi:hypothetical protein